MRIEMGRGDGKCKCTNHLWHQLNFDSTFEHESKSTHTHTNFLTRTLIYFKLKTLFQMPEDDSPISEYHLWREEEAEYKFILEQIKNPFVICCLGR